ncbi:MAG: hypothetical protein ACOX7H_05430 [Bacillota bacterium]|jgi:hypothetical protein
MTEHSPKKDDAEGRTGQAGRPRQAEKAIKNDYPRSWLKDKTKKRRVALLAALAVIIALIAYDASQEGGLFWGMSDYVARQGIDIEIKNCSDEPLLGWNIVYDGNKNTPVLDLAPNKKFRTTLLTNDTVGESEVRLLWQDKKAKPQEKVILGYYERGYNAKVLVLVQLASDGSFIVQSQSSYY